MVKRIAENPSLDSKICHHFVFSTPPKSPRGNENEFLMFSYSQEGQNTICQVSQSLQSPKKEISNSFSIASAAALRLWKIQSTESDKPVNQIALSQISSLPKVIIFLAFCLISAHLFYFFPK